VGLHHPDFITYRRQLITRGKPPLVALIAAGTARTGSRSRCCAANGPSTPTAGSAPSPGTATAQTSEPVMAISP
jgi:hypothetical protein